MEKKRRPGSPKKKSYPKAGQPTKYRPEFCDEVIRIAEECDPYEFNGIVAVKLMVSRDSIQEWRKVHSKFSAAYKQALDIWGARMTKFFIENKIDIRWYRTLNWQVLRLTTEPPPPAQEIKHTIESIPSILDAIDTDADTEARLEQELEAQLIESNDEVQ